MATRIVIRTPNHLGDCVMALPMVNEVREAYPDSHITLLVPSNLGDLWAGNPAIDEILAVPAEHIHGLLSVVKIKELLTNQCYDIGYILPPSFGAAASFKLAGIRERIGYVADGRRLLLTRPLPLPTPLNAHHRCELYFNLLRRGAEVDLPLSEPRLYMSDSDRARATQLLADFDLSDLDQYVVVAFRAVAQSRRWGIDNYGQLAKWIVGNHRLSVLLVGSSDDRTEGERLVDLAGGTSVVNLAGKTSLRELAAILAGAQLFVGNDSGPAHLAAAVGTPIVVLSGADDPGSTSPISKSMRLLRLDSLDCLACVKNKCPLKGDEQMQCMAGISVEMVTREVERVLAAEL
ncbi:MAG: lipopolysaccharide heptosyltransferase II [Candidatus Zixiibacteriota bacterium]